MLLPCIVALIYREDSLWGFLFMAIIGIAIGTVLTIKKPKNHVFFARDGFAAVALSWIVLSIFGALPFVISGEIPNFINALFETISGFTTTGSSILTDVEALSRSAIFWRSFTHWIGGMGVLVFILTVLPMAGGYHMHLMRAESPGPSVGKLVPRVRETAMILYGIYVAMTVVQIILLLIGQMPLFDALTITFGTAGTGGFGILNDSIASYTPYQQWVITIFMILFGINFNVYYLILIKKVRDAFRYEELRCYLGIIAAAIIMIVINTWGMFDTIGETIRHSAFQVASIITTTGYSTTDFNQWPQLAKSILVLLMFIGACAGSTGGGIKVSRIVLMVKTIGKEMSRVIHPRSVKIIQMEKKKVDHEVIRSVNVFIMAYLILFAISVLLVSIDNFDPTTTFTAVATTLNNLGRLDAVGSASNFASFSPFSKIVLMFDMLAGRLEILPMLILFTPAIWKR